MVEDDLEPLITQCPNCATRFRVTENQLAVAAGRVRCGACLTVFEGTDHLLMDEETPFTTEGEADAALDELLDELRDSEPERSSVVQVDFDKANKSAEDRSVEVEDEFEGPPQIYGGFEEEAQPDLSMQEMVEEPESVWADHAGSGQDSEAAVADDWEQGDSERNDVGAEEAGFEGLDLTDDLADDLENDPADDPADVDLADLEPADLEPADLEPADIDEAAKELEFQEWVSAERPAPDDSRFKAVQIPRAEGEAADNPDRQDAHPELDPVLTTEVQTSAPSSFAPEPRRWWVGVVAIVFMLALVAQIFYFQFPTWSRDTELRPVYELACRWMNCELPGMRDLRQMSTRNLVVRSHPDLSSALVVDAVIVNDAPFEQPFPELEIRFTAVDGLLVAGRRFRPDEYLSGSEVDPDRMPRATPVQVSLEIEDPGPDAVNYTLKFR